MKSFVEFTNKEIETPNVSAVFPTFEEAMTDKEGKSCVSEKMKSLIKELAQCGMTEMKDCHGDETPMTAENWMSECDSYMKECMESLKGCCDECMK